MFRPTFKCTLDDLILLAPIIRLTDDYRMAFPIMRNIEDPLGGHLMPVVESHYQDFVSSISEVKKQIIDYLKSAPTLKITPTLKELQCELLKQCHFSTAYSITYGPHVYLFPSDIFKIAYSTENGVKYAAICVKPHLIIKTPK